MSPRKLTPEEILDLIEALEPDDPRRAQFRRELASRLF